jgi:hypothetical protein
MFAGAGVRVYCLLTCVYSEIRKKVYPVSLDYRKIFDGKMMDEETAKKVW